MGQLMPQIKVNSLKKVTTLWVKIKSEVTNPIVAIVFESSDS